MAVGVPAVAAVAGDAGAIDAAASPAAPFGAFAPSAAQRLLIALARVPPLNRGRLRPILSRLVLGLSQNRLDIGFRGGSFRVFRDDHPIEYGMLLFPGYNGEEFDFLLSGLPAGGVAVDLGANIGMFTIPLALKAGPKGRVLAIDASEAFLSKLAFNAAASALSNVSILPLAVGDREGVVRLKRIDRNPGTAEVEDDSAGGIRMRRLADILADAGIGRIDVMKVDIDGSEDRALTPFFRDAPETLLPRRVVIEHLMMASGDGCVAAMTRRGYRALGRTRSNALYELEP